MGFIREFEPDENGLFPATPSSKNLDMSKYYWLRDNYWIYRSGYYRDSIKTAFNKIVDNISEKLEYHIVNEPPTASYQYIHPRYTSELNEVKGEWGRPQVDSIGYLLEVVEGEERKKLLYDYLSSIGVQTGYGPWEEKPRKLHEYSLAVLFRGVYKTEFTGRYSIMDYIQYLLLTKKRLDSSLDLEKVMANAVTPYYNQSTLEDMIQKLKGEYGLIRYPEDRWDGFTKSAGQTYEWPLGLAFAYLATGDKKYFNELEEIHENYDGIPESINPETGEPNVNQPLIWAEAMYHGIRQELLVPTVKEAK